ncbi:MAG: phage tail protein [Pseudomonadota bacterium]
MADDGSAQSAHVWPLPKFYFEVKWDSSVAFFQAVDGLDVENETIDYRQGDSHGFSKIKMPGMREHSSVTLKRGVLTNDNKVWDWVNEVKMNTIKRNDVAISLLDENGAPTMVWTLINAFPSKIATTDLKAESNEVAVESIDIQHEGIMISNR